MFNPVAMVALEAFLLGNEEHAREHLQSLSIVELEKLSWAMQELLEVVDDVYRQQAETGTYARVYRGNHRHTEERP